MKKILLVLNLFILLFLCSCISTYKLTNFFARSVLKDCLISDMVKPVDAKNIEATSKNHISFETDEEGFYNNVVNIYEYLLSKDFKYFGIEGEVLSTFFGGCPEYAFYESTCLKDHISISNGFLNDSCYIFVWGTEINEGNVLLDDVALTIKYQDGVVGIFLQYNKNVITSYRLKEERGYTLGYLLPWLKDTSLVKTVKKEFIENNTKIVFSMSVTKYVPRYSGEIVVSKCNIDEYDGDSFSYIYSFSDGSQKSVDIVSGCIYIDGIYYKNEDVFYNLSFENYTISYTFLDETIYDVTDSKSISLKDITYVRCDEEYDDYKYEFKSSYGKIRIYSENIFSLNYVYYEIISSNNFSHLFSD